MRKRVGNFSDALRDVQTGRGARKGGYDFGVNRVNLYVKNARDLLRSFQFSPKDFRVEENITILKDTIRHLNDALDVLNRL